MTTHGFDSVGFLRRVLWIVFVISLSGVTFSATLSYLELRGAVASCPAVGASGTIFGLPACVYGLGMYTILAALSGFALFHSRSGALAGASHGAREAGQVSLQKPRVRLASNSRFLFPRRAR